MSTLQVKTIDHVTLVVADLERTRDFYVGRLGMEDANRPDFHFPGAWYRAGETFVHVILEDEHSGPAGNVVAPGASPGRTRHLAFLVEDVEEATRFLVESGDRVASPPQVRPDGVTQVFFYDPDGHVIELSSLPDPVG